MKISNSSIIVLVLILISFILIDISEKVEESNISKEQKILIEQQEKHDEQVIAEYAKQQKIENLEAFENAKLIPFLDWTEKEYLAVAQCSFILYGHI